jgi:hypothetical protein
MMGELETGDMITHNITLQKPKPSEDAALRNLSLDYKIGSIEETNTRQNVEPTMNLPRRTPSTRRNIEH